MLKSKVTTVGSSIGVVLPKEILAKLRMEKGDSLYFMEWKIEIFLLNINFHFLRMEKFKRRNWN